MAWPAWLLLAATAALLLYPLWWRTREPLPTGLEGGEETRDLTAEKRRLLGNLRRLRLDYSEGRLAEADFTALEREIQQHLAAVMDGLARGTDGGEAAAVSPRPRLNRLGSAALLLVLVLATWAVFKHLRPDGDGGAAPSTSMADAVSALDRKLAADPKNVDAWALAGRTYEALGKKEQAFQAWSRVLALEPENGEALFNLALALISNEDRASAETALGYLDKLAKKEPDAPQLLWYRGLALFNLGRKGEAREVWLRLQPMLPADSENARLVRDALKKTGS